MAENPNPVHPRNRELALSSLRLNPGWQVYCDRFAKVLENEIEAKVWDLKTSDEDRKTLVAARKLLVDSYAPEKMIEAMITQASNEANAIDRGKKT